MYLSQCHWAFCAAGPRVWNSSAAGSYFTALQKYSYLLSYLHCYGHGQFFVCIATGLRRMERMMRVMSIGRSLLITGRGQTALQLTVFCIIIRWPRPLPALPSFPKKSQALQSEHINKQNHSKDRFWLMYYGDRYLNNLITFCELPTNASANDKTHIYIGLPVKLLFHVS